MKANTIIFKFRDGSVVEFRKGRSCWHLHVTNSEFAIDDRGFFYLRPTESKADELRMKSIRSKVQSSNLQNLHS